ncbi:hypothetical protein MKX01_001930, partial [Papaver californicum]
KFQLFKDRLFGQDILVVDNPIIGVWDPSNAIILEWSDGHLWSVQLISSNSCDIAINKSIQFKFILKEPTKEVIWKPDKIIVIFEEWDNVELHMITEEDLIEDSMLNSDTQEDLVVNSNTTEPTISLITTIKKLAYPEAENTDMDDFVTSIGSFVTEKTSMSLKDEDTSFQYKGEPILVPGLAPLSTTTVEEGLTQVFKSDIIVETPTTPTNSNVVDTEVKAKNDYKPESARNDNNEAFADEEQDAGVGIEKNCQSTDEELEVLDLPSTDDVDILKTNLKRDEAYAQAF